MEGIAMSRLSLILFAGPVLGLAACGELPDLRQGGRTLPSPAVATIPPPEPMPPEMSVPEPLPGARPSPAQAETACMAAGRERGFVVQGVVGSSDVAGADGLPVSRDVMLRVARGAQVFDLRCNYHYGGAQARIMVL